MRDEVKELKKQLNQISQHDGISLYASPIKGNVLHKTGINFLGSLSPNSRRSSPNSREMDEAGKLKSQLRDSEALRLAQEREIVALKQVTRYIK